MKLAYEASTVRKFNHHGLFGFLFNDGRDQKYLYGKSISGAEYRVIYPNEPSEKSKVGRYGSN